MRVDFRLFVTSLIRKTLKVICSDTGAATRENRSSVFPTRSDTNRTVQLQKQARSLKFWLYVEEELYYPSSENKGADQLRSYCEADLRLCFRIGNDPVVYRRGSLLVELCPLEKLI